MGLTFLMATTTVQQWKEVTKTGTSMMDYWNRTILAPASKKIIHPYWIYPLKLSLHQL
jgi:hypothetical protein